MREVGMGGAGGGIQFIQLNFVTTKTKKLLQQRNVGHMYVCGTACSTRSS